MLKKYSIYHFPSIYNDVWHILFVIYTLLGGDYFFHCCRRHCFQHIETITDLPVTADPTTAAQETGRDRIALPPNPPPRRGTLRSILETKYARICILFDLVSVVSVSQPLRFLYITVFKRFFLLLLSLVLVSFSVLSFNILSVCI